MSSVVLGYIPPGDPPEQAFKVFAGTRGGGAVPTWFRYERSINERWGWEPWAPGHAMIPRNPSAYIRGFEQALVLHDPADDEASEMGVHRFERITRLSHDRVGWMLGLPFSGLLVELEVIIPRVGGRLVFIDPSTGQEITP